MAKMMEEQGSQFETETLGIFRTASTVKGGRRFSFGALVVAGDRNGKVGFGHAKSKEVPTAIEKAEKAAKRAMVKIPRVGSTIPHQVEGRFGASKVRLIPASPGTGVVAGGTVRSVLEAAGVSDCLTKCYGSTNKMNMIRAVFDGLERLRTKEHVEGIRDQQLGTTEIESKIARGQRPSCPRPPRRREDARPGEHRGPGATPRWTRWRAVAVVVAAAGEAATAGRPPRGGGARGGCSGAGHPGLIDQQDRTQRRLPEFVAMMIHDITSQAGANKNRKRVSSGHGPRDHQEGRPWPRVRQPTGRRQAAAFEGGTRCPTSRGMPKFGFTNAQYKTRFFIVNLGDTVAHPDFAKRGFSNFGFDAETFHMKAVSRRCRAVLSTILGDTVDAAVARSRTMPQPNRVTFP